ncbi:MAG: hypothetical protein IJT56_09025 [Clostridia bacterium]|nr:hypothetical protein [Clostridia bacterium]
MIRVSSVQDKDAQRVLCGMCGIEYDPDFMAYEAQDDETGEVLCCAQFTLAAGGFGVLESIGTADISEKAEKEFTRNGILLVTGRAAMNFMDLAGFHKARPSAEILKDEHLTKMLGFSRGGDGIWSCDLERLFMGEHHA